MLHGVAQCRSGAGGDCGPEWDVAAVVEHDITGVHGMMGSNVMLACGMWWPHREPAPTLVTIWARDVCVCGYMRALGTAFLHL